MHTPLTFIVLDAKITMKTYPFVMNGMHRTSVGWAAFPPEMLGMHQEPAPPPLLSQVPVAMQKQ